MLFGLLLYTVLYTWSTADHGTIAIGGRYSTVPHVSVFDHAPNQSCNAYTSSPSLIRRRAGRGLDHEISINGYRDIKVLSHQDSNNWLQ
jgi:hypothetical protein